MQTLGVVIFLFHRPKVKNFEQEVLGRTRTNHLLSFDKTLRAQKMTCPTVLLLLHIFVAAVTTLSKILLEVIQRIFNDFGSLNEGKP